MPFVSHFAAADHLYVRIRAVEVSVEMKHSRRRFLQTAGAVGAAATVGKVGSAPAYSNADLGIRTGLTPDDSPIFLHDTSTREIYALDVDFPK